MRICCLMLCRHEGERMIKYILKRLLQLIPILIGITFLSFAMMRLAGGDAVTYMYENAGSAVSQEVIDETRAGSAVSCAICKVVCRNGNRRYGQELCIEERCL